MQPLLLVSQVEMTTIFLYRSVIQKTDRQLAVFASIIYKYKKVGLNRSLRQLACTAGIGQVENISFIWLRNIYKILREVSHTQLVKMVSWSKGVQVPSPRSSTPNPESQIPDPESQIPVVFHFYILEIVFHFEILRSSLN